ncbi:hypothetical protein [Citrobacter amalonaticus]|uniref:hypothetical protein n=1 Tax=Citrobacter amalonaticus TaxID=35703 RepID=UPI0018AB1CB0|nr:hypothetical protein [Citrobacter amalonaticus]
MQTQYSFSPSQSLFYANALKESVYDPAGIWPEDAFDIDDAVMMEFTSAPPVGKKLGADDNGNPAWIDAPAIPTDILYELELNEINSDYEKDVSDLVLKYSRAGLFDGSTEASKKTELFAALQARKEKYSTDLDALDIKYGA